MILTSENIQSHAWLMLEDGHTIIDITGDQFHDKICFLNYNKSVYIGVEDDFHKLFSVEDRDIRKNNGLSALKEMCHPRLDELYKKIIKYLP